MNSSNCCGVPVLMTSPSLATRDLKASAWATFVARTSLAVFLIAVAFGRRLAVATLLLYMAQGAMGLPVFQKGGAVLIIDALAWTDTPMALATAYVVPPLARNGRIADWYGRSSGSVTRFR